MSVRRQAIIAGLAVMSLTVALESSRSQAYVELSGANINLRNGGSAAKADWLRYKLVEVNGPTGGYILAAGHGDQRGYLGTINALTGGRFLGALLEAADIDSCAAIPTYGELAGRAELEGEQVNARAELGAGTRQIPAHYSEAGGTYEKQIVLYEGANAVLEIQLSCSGADGLTTGYFYRPPDDDNDRPREVYFQQNERTGLSRVDFYMSHAPSGEHYAFRFDNDSSGTVRIWNVRAMSKSRDSSGFAATYKPATGIALTGFLTGARDATDTTSLVEAELECLSLKPGDGPWDCEADALAITAPAETAPIGGARHPFTIAGANSFQLRSDRPVRAREQMPSPRTGSDAATDDDAGDPLGYGDDEDAGI